MNSAGRGPASATGTGRAGPCPAPLPPAHENPHARVHPVKLHRSGQYRLVSDRWCTSDGWGVEVTRMLATPDRHEGESFRVSHYGFHVGYAHSVAELERWIDLRDLEEALNLVCPRPRSACPCRAAACTRGSRTPQPCRRLSGVPVPASCTSAGRAHFVSGRGCPTRSIVPVLDTLLAVGEADRPGDPILPQDRAPKIGHHRSQNRTRNRGQARLMTMQIADLRELGGRYWDRTSDLLGVNEALSR
jgi:hypothetical protein